MANPRRLRSEKLYAGRVFSLVVDDVEYPSGRRTIREIADHPGGAVAVPTLDNGDLVLIRQYRYPVGQEVYELPAGKLNPGEDPMACALRELEEETGLTATRLEKLTSIFTSPGFCNEILHLYHATGLHATGRGQQLEEGESGLAVEIVPFHRAVRMIEAGTIVDGKSICGILLTDRLLKHGKQPA